MILQLEERLETTFWNVYFFCHSRCLKILTSGRVQSPGNQSATSTSTVCKSEIYLYIYIFWTTNIWVDGCPIDHCWWCTSFHWLQGTLTASHPDVFKQMLQYLSLLACRKPWRLACSSCCVSLTSYTGDGRVEDVNICGDECCLEQTLWMWEVRITNVFMVEWVLTKAFKHSVEGGGRIRGNKSLSHDYSKFSFKKIFTKLIAT